MSTTNEMLQEARAKGQTVRTSKVLPTYFKYAVESKQPTFEDINGNKCQVVIGLNPDPATNAFAACDSFGVVMASCANAMASNQFKNKGKSALVFNKDDNGEIIAAVISDYDPEGENYFYNITFNPDDIKGASVVVDYKNFVSDSNYSFAQLVNSNYMLQHNIAVSDKTVLDTLIISVFECLYKYLDENAKDGEIVTLIIDDYLGNYQMMTAEEYENAISIAAIASVETVKDIKKMSIQFSEELKAIAKGNGDSSQG
jgi:hypothetical protein